MNIETLVQGKWLLTSAKDLWRVRFIRFLSFGKLPVHGVKFVFHHASAGLHGATINWRTGEERPLASLRFDGVALELRMESAAALLTMAVAGDQLEGHYMDSDGQTLGPKLRMIKYAGR